MRPAGWSGRRRTGAPRMPERAVCTCTDDQPCAACRAYGPEAIAGPVRLCRRCHTAPCATQQAQSRYCRGCMAAPRYATSGALVLSEEPGALVAMAGSWWPLTALRQVDAVPPTREETC